VANGGNAINHCFTIRYKDFVHIDQAAYFTSAATHIGMVFLLKRQASVHAVGVSIGTKTNKRIIYGGMGLHLLS
jgi:hypothetical protein